MNYWTKLSADFANQNNYLDELFRVYPTIPEGIREIDRDKWEITETAFGNARNEDLVEALLSFDLFPIKDSYVAYLRRDKGAIRRNPDTINRLSGRLYEMGLSKVYEKCTEPKETNRQIGPLFKKWVKKGSLGIFPVKLKDFIATTENAILDASDHEMKEYAVQNLGYKIDKGLDFVARFNGKYVIGEAKFLSDFGGHQNAQYNDAIAIFETEVNANVITIAVLDGVLYIPTRGGRKKMSINTNNNIMSSLVLREFLYQL